MNNFKFTPMFPVELNQSRWHNILISKIYPYPVYGGPNAGAIGEPERIIEIADPVDNPIASPNDPDHIPDYVPDDFPTPAPSEP